MANANFTKSLKIALSVCLICSLLVSSAAILLKTKQDKNQSQYRVKNILVAAGLYRENLDIETVYRRRVEPLLIDLDSGNEVDPKDIGPNFRIQDFDIESFITDSNLSEDVPSDNDLAKIGRRPRFMVVYLTKTNGYIDKLILPVFGKGLWSTIYGLLALDGNLNTIAGISFYQHGETPGLGGEIENPKWLRGWQGKQAFDPQGRVIIQVLRGEVDEDSPSAQHQIDGLAGATLTSRGIQNMLQYWLGEHGYAPLLKRLRRQWLQLPPTQAERDFYD